MGILSRVRIGLVRRYRRLRYGGRGRALTRPPSISDKTWRIETNENHAMRHAWVKSVVSGTVLDVGAGHGYVTCQMATVADHVTALDATDKYREAARDLARVNNIDNIDFASGNAYDLPFPDDSFETVALLEILEHLENPQKAASEALRVARRRVVVTVPAHDRMTELPGHINNFTTQEVVALFQNVTYVKVRDPFLFLVAEKA